MSTRSLTLALVATVVVVWLPGAGGHAADQWAEARARLARSAAVMPLPAKAEPAAAAAEGEREAVALATPARASEVEGRDFDLVVVGGSGGGVMAAVRAAREGASVLLVQHNRHIGGMMVNGLMQWDALSGAPRAALFTELLTRIERHYARQSGVGSPDHRAACYTHEQYPVSWVEPHVVEREFNRLVAAEPRITLLLDRVPVAAEREGRLIRSLTLGLHPAAAAAAEPATITVRGTTYIDATYEGDLLPVVGTAYRVGREARAEFDEPHAGKVFTTLVPGPAPRDAFEARLAIRPYGDRQGPNDPASPHSADGCIQAYNYRFCVTSDPANRLPVPKPASYDRGEYLKFTRRYIATNGRGQAGKSHCNSPILPGENHAYPEASWEEREPIIRRHLDFGLGLIWFLQHDESIPEKQRQEFLRWGLPRDEFADNGHVPYEMYVREARRLVGRHVFTEHDNSPAAGLARPPIQPDAIAVTDWYMDSHACTTDSRPGFPYDGKLILTEQSRPAQVPYRALLPRDLDNVLVPICLSATHVAWGAIRLEPVFMQTGEAAGLAAALVRDGQFTAGTLPGQRLVRELILRRQLVTFFNDLRVQPLGWHPDAEAPAAEPALADAEADADDARIRAAQWFGTLGLFPGYDARLAEPLTAAVKTAWEEAVRAASAAPEDGQAFDPTAAARRVALAEAAPPSADSPPLGQTRGAWLEAAWQAANGSGR